MRVYFIIALSLAICDAAFAQQSQPAVPTGQPAAASQRQPAGQQAPRAAAFSIMASSADIQALIAQLKRERKDQTVAMRPLLQVPGYSMSLEYRLAPARAVVHETDSELIYVVDGKGTLTVGGTLVNPQRQNAQNLAAAEIQGGTPHALGKGDFFLIQNGTTHSFTAIDGELLVISLRLPAPPQQ